MNTKNTIITINTYPSRMDAELAKSLLDSAGIESFISADDEGGMLSFPHGSLSASGVKLLIKENDKTDAEKVLKLNS